jgi:hypothetical protein
MIRFSCTACQTFHDAPVEQSGQRFDCPECGFIMNVPAAADSTAISTATASTPAATTPSVTPTVAPLIPMAAPMASAPPGAIPVLTEKDLAVAVPVVPTASGQRTGRKRWAWVSAGLVAGLVVLVVLLSGQRSKREGFPPEEQHQLEKFIRDRGLKVVTALADLAENFAGAALT